MQEEQRVPQALRVIKDRRAPQALPASKAFRGLSVELARAGLAGLLGVLVTLDQVVHRGLEALVDRLVHLDDLAHRGRQDRPAA